MSLKVFKSGLAKLVDTTNVCRIYKSGAWKDVARMRIWKTDGTGGAWRDLWIKSTYTPPASPPPAPPPPPPPPPVVLSVSIAPNPAYASNPTHNFATISNLTGGCSNAVGGVASWQWSLVSWDAATPPTFSAPSTQVTNLTQNMPLNSNASATIKLTVVDAAGNIGSTTCDCGFDTDSSGSSGGGGSLP